MTVLHVSLRIRTQAAAPHAALRAGGFSPPRLSLPAATAALAPHCAAAAHTCGAAAPPLDDRAFDCVTLSGYLCAVHGEIPAVGVAVVGVGADLREQLFHFAEAVHDREVHCRGRVAARGLEKKLQEAIAR